MMRSFGMTKQSPSPQHHSPAALRWPPREIQLSWANVSGMTSAKINEGQRKPDEASEHGLSLSLSRRGDRLIQADGSCVPAWLQAARLHAALRTSAIPWVDSPPKRWNQPLDMEL